MSYSILCDSCTDFTPALRSDSHYKRIPLTIHIGDYDIIDDDTFDQKDFLKRIAEYPACPKSSCPSPESYKEHFEEADDIYIVTLSSHLSGSYNSAVLAQNMYRESHPDKNIRVFDSQSASVGQTLIAMKINELAGSGLSFDEVNKQIDQFISHQGTKFVLETLEILRKNGRLSRVTATAANILNIKPVMTGVAGEIEKLTQTRGMKKAIQKLAEAVAGDVVEPQKRILAIAHCNNRERAEYTKEEILKLVPFKDVYITDTAGISSLYAADGGIIVSY